MGVGMGGDQRRVREAGNIVEALFIEVRQIDHDPELVAGPDQVLAGIGQPWSGVRIAGKAERDAVAEYGRTAPDRAERAQTHGVEGVERVEVGSDGFRTLHVHDRGDGAGFHAGAEVGRAAADLERTFGGPLHPHQMPGHGDGRCLGLGCRHQRGQRQVIGRHVHHRLVIGRICFRRRRNVDGEEAAGETGLLHPRKIEMSFLPLFQPEGFAPLRLMQQTQQEIIVAVKERNSRHVWLHQRRRAGSRVKPSLAVSRLRV
jgi:hypothetical protein